MKNPFTAAQTRAIEALARLWGPDRQFVLVGASAIACHLEHARGTADLDVAVAVAEDELPLGMDKLPGWRRHPQREHEWHGPGDVRVDVVPAGPALTARGYFDWPSGHRMTLAGFEHAFVRKRDLELGAACTLAVADLAVIALLKVVAYLDRGVEREHDLTDLALIIDQYVAADDDRRWSDEVVELQVPYDLVGAFLLGRDLAGFVTARDRANLERFVGIARGDETATRLARLAPIGWGRSEAGVLERLSWLAAGVT